MNENAGRAPLRAAAPGVNRKFGEYGLALLATRMAAIAGNLHFFTACVFTEVAAKLFMLWKGALTRLVCAKARFRFIHNDRD